MECSSFFNQFINRNKMVKFVCMSLAEYKLCSSTFTVYYGLHKCPFGKCLIGIISKEKTICHLQFIDKYDSAKCVKEFKSDWPGANFMEKTEETEKVLEKIFSSKNHDNISVFLKGTDFQINVWKALTKIPRAEVVNYSYIAELINNPKSIRAIAKVVGSNRVAYIIPCHRVISKSGPSKTCWRTDKRAPMLEYEKNI